MKDVIVQILLMFTLTCVVGFSLGIARMIAIKNGFLKVRYFRLFTGDTPPDNLEKLRRNFSNLLEVPTLFYILILFQLVEKNITQFTIIGAWIFVSLRVIHSLIHVTYNNPLHRFIVFLASNFVLITMWITFALNYF